MQNPPQVENEIRLQNIIKLLKSCPELKKTLNSIDDINNEINEKILPSLVEDTSELGLLLKDQDLRGSSYQQLIDESSNLEYIINFPSKTDEYLDNPDDLVQCVQYLEMIEQLHKNLAHQVPIIDKLFDESRKKRETLVANCCDKLERLDNPPMEKLVSMVDNLMICGKFNEMQIRLKFLEARDNWFNSACEEQGASFDNVVQVHCNGLPMIFNEYKILFCQNDNQQQYSSRHRNKSTDITLQILDQDEFTIINTWLLLKASMFISALESYLNAIHENDNKSPGMIEDTIDKCSQLALGLSTFGFDFSSQLRPLFINAISREIKKSLELVTEHFEASFGRTIVKSIESLLLPIDDDVLRKPYIQIPKSIEHYPLFKIYCIRLVESLRWVKTAKNLISPINVCRDTYSALNSSLNRVMNAIGVAMNLDDNANNIHLTKIAIAMMSEFVPFISDHCEKFFPQIVLSGMRKVAPKSNSFSLDMKFIGEPLKTTMPTLLETIMN